MLQQTLWWASAILCVLTIARLAREALLRRPPFMAFAAMQAAMLLRDLTLFAIPVQSLRYTVAWEITLPVVLFTQAFAGVSCYRAIAARYPKIGRFATQLFAGSLIVSALVSFAGLPLELSQRRSHPILHSLFICYRWTDTILAGGLVLAVAVLARFPPPLRKSSANLTRHTALLAAYFSLYAVAYFLPVAGISHIDLVRTSVVCILYLTWSVCLSARGEEIEYWPQVSKDTSDWISARNAHAEAMYNAASLR